MSDLSLNQVESFPAKLLEILPDQLYTLFPQPTILHLPGKQPEPVFISILLHGNEIAGLHVVQKLLKKYLNITLPRAVSIFFGNTQAARYAKRMLDHQPDYNRIWPGTIATDSLETAIMQNIVNEMQVRNVFASIDIHNNTGLNPHYACINRLENRFLQLAGLFGSKVVYFLTPRGVQSMAFSEYCPAVTLECGKPDSQSGVNHALEYIDTVLHMQQISNDPVLPRDIKLFHTVARVKIPENLTFSFTDCNADILLRQELENMNFSEIPANTCFGLVQSNIHACLFAINDYNQEVSKEFFYIDDRQIKLTKPIMPAMLTLDEEIIRQDCLCYLMQRLPQPDTNQN